jgi:hypothetical protein
MVAGEPGTEIQWQEGTPAGSLAIDLIAASGGVPVEMRGRLLVARFPGVHPACLTARRLQWAMQGLAGHSPDAAVALAALIQTGDDSTSENEGTALAELEKAPAGKILLAKHAGQVLEREPGFATRNAQGGLELVWRSPDEQTTRAADQLALASFSRQVQSDHDATIDASEFLARDRQAVQPGATGVLSAPGLGKTNLDPDESPRRPIIRWALGAAAAAVLAVGGFYAFSHGSKPPASGNSGLIAPQPASTAATSPAATSPAVQPPSASPASATSESPNQPDTSAASNPKLSRREKAKLQAQESSKTATENAKPQPAAQPEAPKVVAGDCQYQLDQISGLLARAENSRARGEYQDAKRKFTAVLACDRGNSRAQEGLQQVLQAIKAEGSDQ